MSMAPAQKQYSQNSWYQQDQQRVIEEKKEKERLAEEERKRAEEAERKRKEAEEAEKVRIAEEKRLEEERTQQMRDEVFSKYRESYDAGEIETFNQAKTAADETYMQYWYDRHNEILDSWSDEDWDLFFNPKYNKEGYGHKAVITQILPEGTEELYEIRERIEQGPLDFTDRETHRMLINPPSKIGYGKKQSWISPNDPLRQAVEAQAEVMENFLDEAGIPIYQEFENGNPDNVYGQGIYLNTGTAAHIDWDAELKREQRYISSPDAEIGTYSQVFVRPEASSIVDALIAPALKIAYPPLAPYITAAQGGDWKDIAISYVSTEMAPDLLESGLAELGVDADLFGLDPAQFSESMTNVQTAAVTGESIGDAIIDEFGTEVLKKVEESLPDLDLPDVDTPQFLKDTEDFLQDVTQPVSDVLSDVEDVILDTASTIDDVVIQPVLEGVEEFTQPASDVLSDVEDVVKEGASELEDFLQEATQPVSDVLSDAEDVVSDVLSEGEDVVKEIGGAIDDVVNWEKVLTAGLMGGLGIMGGQPRPTASTATEQLFDKELFKFDTEIKSTQEMLSPMMNLRRYV